METSGLSAIYDLVLCHIAHKASAARILRMAFSLLAKVALEWTTKVYFGITVGAAAAVALALLLLLLGERASRLIRRLSVAPEAAAP